MSVSGKFAETVIVYPKLFTIVHLQRPWLLAHYDKKHRQSVIRKMKKEYKQEFEFTSENTFALQCVYSDLFHNVRPTATTAILLLLVKMDSGAIS